MMGYKRWPYLMALIRKEILATLKEKSSRAILLGPIIIYTVLFGYIATFNLDRVPYALCDLSHSAESTQLIRAIDQNQIFQRVETLQNTAQINESVERGDALLVVVIEPQFAQKLKEGKAGQVQVIVDGRNSSTAQLAVGYLGTIAQAFNVKLMGMEPSITTRVLYNVNSITQWFIMPGLIVMLSMMQVIVLSALSVAKEREQETFEQLLVTPYTTGELLLSKMIVPMVVGLFQCSLIFMVDVWWFEIPLAGSILAIYTVVIMFMLAVVGLGLTISAYSRTMQQALLLGFVCLMPMILLSGLFSPVANMPDVLQWLTYLDPLRFALAAVRRIYLTGASFWDVAPTLWPLVLMASILLPSAYHFFKKRL